MTIEEWEEYKKKHYKYYKSRLDQLLQKIWEQKETRLEEILDEIQKGEEVDVEKLVACLPFGNIIVFPLKHVRAIKDTGLPPLAEEEIKTRLLQHSIYQYKKFIPYRFIEKLFYELRSSLVEDGYDVGNFKCPPIACILLKFKQYKEWTRRTYGLFKTKEEYGAPISRKRATKWSLGNISMGYYSFLIVLKKLKKTKYYTDTINHELLHIFEAYLKLPPGTLTKKYGF